MSVVFEITNDGVIRTKRELDRENVPLYELIVVAQDNGMPTMQGNATVTITILDENDNSPVFTNGSLMDVSIMEVNFSFLVFKYARNLAKLFLRIDDHRE